MTTLRSSCCNHGLLSVGLSAFVMLLLLVPAGSMLQGIADRPSSGSASASTEPSVTSEMANLAPPPSTPAGNASEATLLDDESMSLRSLAVVTDTSFDTYVSEITKILGIVVGVAAGVACVVAVAAFVTWTYGTGLVVAAPWAWACIILIGVEIGLLWAQYAFFQQASESQPPSDLYAPAVEEMLTILGAANVSYQFAAQSVEDYIAGSVTADWNTLGYANVRAAEAQLGSANWNYGEDLWYSGVLTQFLSIVDGEAIQTSNATEIAYQAANYFYNPTDGGYGANGQVCLLGNSAQDAADGGSVVTAPYVISSGMADVGNGASYAGGVFGPSVPDYSTAGSCWTAFDTSGVAYGPLYGPSVSGITFPLGLEQETYQPEPVYLSGENATFALEQPWTVSEIANSVFLNFTNATGHETSIVIEPDSTLTVGLPQGIYTLNASIRCGVEYGCNGEQETYWVGAEPVLLGLGVWPLANFSWGPSEWSAFNATLGFAGFENPVAGPMAGQAVELFACNGGGGSLLENSIGYYYGGPSESGNVSQSVEQCPMGVGGIVHQLETYSYTLANIGEAYWLFLHSLGVYQASTIPASCVIPPVTDFLPADTPLSVLEAMSPLEIWSLFDAYVIALGGSYGSSNTLNDTTFCGFHLQPPSNITLQDPHYAIIGDIFLANSGENFGNLATWFAQGLALHITPTLGNITIFLNKTWEAPAANPSTVYYGPLTYPMEVSELNASNVGNATFLPEGYLDNFVGNSTLTNGTVFPYSTDARLGQGDALHITECWAQSPATGLWGQSPTCNYGSVKLNYTINATSGSCYTLGACSNQNGSGGFPLANSGNCDESGLIGETLSTIAGPLVGIFGAIPFVSHSTAQTWACDVAWVVLIVIVLVVIYAIVKLAVYLARSRRK